MFENIKKLKIKAENTAGRKNTAVSEMGAAVYDQWKIGSVNIAGGQTWGVLGQRRSVSEKAEMTGTVKVPKGVGSIGDGAFRECISLGSINLASS